MATKDGFLCACTYWSASGN